MKMKLYAVGTVTVCLMWCAACTPAPAVPPLHAVYNICPRVSSCPMPGSEPMTNGDLSADIRRLEQELITCALQIETIKECQGKSNE
ncbi:MULTISPECIES: Rz1-like lysis system protein LysC [unclassified Lelliottia]|uniref:Rz1-like lysis system protein LysC n=1 Tax=unclassified Lelliottia TaxID=2642424 RepID=UPI001E589B2E|nr:MULTISPECIES: Rz1-like lysis system protein LysC [unclassified Lelliottia]